jgi:acyl-CoA thioesterase FadM
VPDWIETYRGVVNAWECDVVEHFTIAYYFDRFADATRNYLDLIGVGESVNAGVNVAPSRLHVTFRHELRGGAQFHMLSGLTGLDAGTLRLGHQVVDSTTGEILTWVAESIALPPALAPAARKKLEGLVQAWPGPAVPEPASAMPGQGPATLRDRVKPWEIGESGALSLPGYVHRFSAAAMQTLAAIGMTGAYMQQNRRGFSTFELDLNLLSPAKVGDMADITTVFTHLGSSSVRFVHTMICKQTGRPLATMGQSGVQLDLDARKSTRLPDELRALANKLLVTAQ